MKRLHIDSSCMVLSPEDPFKDHTPAHMKKRKQLHTQKKPFAFHGNELASFIQPFTFQFETQNAHRNEYFERFPRELFAIILSNLPRSSICNSFTVCKAWSKQSSNEYLWKLLYERDIQKLGWNCVSWKELYIRWVLANGLEIRLSVNKNYIRSGDEVKFDVVLSNTRNTSVGVAVGHSSCGNAIENGSLFKLQCTLPDSRHAEVGAIADPNQRQQLTENYFFVVSIPATTSVLFSVVAQCSHINQELGLGYIFSDKSGIRHALPIPAADHSLSLPFQCFVFDTNSPYRQLNTSSNFDKVWKGKTISNSVAMHCIQ